jgi:para-aminobenzoate synthetase component 1
MNTTDEPHAAARPPAASGFPADSPPGPAVDPAMDPRGWVARRWFTPSGAAVAELRPGVAAVDVFTRLADLSHCLFLDSALVDAAPPTAHSRPAARLGRHSFVAADPIHSIEVDARCGPDAPARVAAAFATVRSLLADLACATIPGLPPFQGGVAGFVSYECGLTRLGIPVAGPSAVPLLSLHVYDVVCCFDHDAGRGWIVSQGVPARGPAARRRRATERLDSFIAAATAAAPHAADSGSPSPDHTRAAGTPLSPDPVAPTPPAGRVRIDLPVAGLGDVTSTRSRADYVEMVRTCIGLVRAGDIFQANVAQELRVEAAVDPVALHLRGRAINAAPFAGFLRAGAATVVSMSPERLLRAERGVVRMHPIKGTRRVLSIPEADLYAGGDLEASEKDRAENVMIVDLVRNDLSRVCTPQSVRVESLCRLERYRYVQHLVSIVSGRLRPGHTALDALEVAIPGGSVTGAPKHRACEVIAALEGFRRDAYCGSLGYLGLDGAADFNLLIRTFIVEPTAIRFAVGGGITARSDPAAEYAETLHKAEGMLRVLASFDGMPPVAKATS